MKKKKKSLTPKKEAQKALQPIKKKIEPQKKNTTVLLKALTTIPDTGKEEIHMCNIKSL